MADDTVASQNRGPEVLTVTVALFVAATVAVILRFVSRAGIVRRISADDYAMILAWVSHCHECLQRFDIGLTDAAAHRFRLHFFHLLRHDSGPG